MQRRTDSTFSGAARGDRLARVAPHVRELARTVADEGVVGLSEAVARIRAHARGVGVDLSEEDVHRALSGSYERLPGEPRTRAEAERQIEAWMAELRNVDARARRAGKTSAAKAEALRRRDARGGAGRGAVEAPLGERSRLEGAIARLRERLRAGDLAAKGRPAPDPELAAEYRRRDALRAAIRERIEARRPGG